MGTLAHHGRERECPSPPGRPWRESRSSSNSRFVSFHFGCLVCPSKCGVHVCLRVPTLF